MTQSPDETAKLLEQASIWYWLLKEEDTELNLHRFSRWIRRSRKHYQAFLLFSGTVFLVEQFDEIPCAPGWPHST